MHDSHLLRSEVILLALYTCLYNQQSSFGYLSLAVWGSGGERGCQIYLNFSDRSPVGSEWS